MCLVGVIANRDELKKSKIPKIQLIECEQDATELRLTTVNRVLSSAKLSIFPFPTKVFQLRILIFIHFVQSTHSAHSAHLTPFNPSKKTQPSCVFLILKTLINSVVLDQVHDDDDEGDEDDDKAHPSRTSPSSSTRARQWQMLLQ